MALKGYSLNFNNKKGNSNHFFDTVIHNLPKQNLYNKHLSSQSFFLFILTLKQDPKKSILLYFSWFHTTKPTLISQIPLDFFVFKPSNDKNINKTTQTLCRN